LKKFSVERKDKSENRTAIEISGLEMPDWIAALLIGCVSITVISLGVVWYLRQ
jgi:hypothetical protein